MTLKIKTALEKLLATSHEYFQELISADQSKGADGERKISCPHQELENLGVESLLPQGMIPLDTETSPFTR